MDITVTIPNGKVDNIVSALSASPPPGFTQPTGTATEIRNALAAFYADKWKSEVRDILKQHRRQQAIQAAVAADQALPDPLA